MSRRRTPDLRRLLTASISLVALLASAAARAQSKSFDVPAQPAATGIAAFAQQADVQVLISVRDADGKITRPVHGDHPVAEGLKLLLAGTGLVAEETGPQTYTVMRAEKQPPRPKQLGDAGGAAPSEGSGTASASEEIIVTAQKREEKLKSVPMPVSVLNADKLADNGQLLLRDYYAKIPGLISVPNFLNSQSVSIRGVSPGGNTPTVSIVVDDIPISGSLTSTGANDVLDFDPGDLARIEVLRGPQGTLYGASSMGGLLKYVTKDPSTTRFSGRIEAGSSWVSNGAEPGYNLRGSFNVPLGADLAVRVSGFTRQDPGYIDNPVTGQKGVNKAEVYGGRLSALWAPTDNFSMKLSAQYQRSDWDGLSEAVLGPTLHDLQENYLPNSGVSHQTVQVYGAIVKYDLGGVELTSVTGYSLNQGVYSLDWSNIYAKPVKIAFGVPSVIYHGPFDVDKLTQEARASGMIGDDLDWLVGAFYTHEHNPRLQIGDAVDPSTNQILGEFYRFKGPVVFDEYAVFGDVTYRFTDDFDLQLGLRQAYDSANIPQAITTGPYTTTVLGHSSPVFTPATNYASDSLTYLATPRFKISPDFMVYARFASGYRSGQPNTVFSPGIPLQSNPDTTRDYELGAKGDIFGKVMSVDAALYYIDWQDIQVQARDPVSNYVFTGNGGSAKSEGIELSISSEPTDGLTISAWGTYNDAELTAAFPPGPIHGVSGNRLPYSPRVSGNISLEQRVQLPLDLTGFVEGTVIYVGDSYSTFTNSVFRQLLPAYTRTDLRLGVESDSWTATVYVNNLTDERAILNGGIGYFNPPARIYITPRTVGLSLSKTF